jgi:hypothetical protein
VGIDTFVFTNQCSFLPINIRFYQQLKIKIPTKVSVKMFPESVGGARCCRSCWLVRSRFVVVIMLLTASIFGSNPGEFKVQVLIWLC